MTGGYEFVNVSGGCSDPFCDYQVQCGSCFQASERQYNEWFVRAGHPRSLFALVIGEMREQAHTEAINEDCTRGQAA